MMSDVIPLSSPPVNVDTLVSKMTRRNKNARKTNIDRRDGLPEPVWDFMNEENRCLRLIFLRWFQDPILPLPSDYPKSWCCSICNLALDVTGLELDVRCGSEVMNLDDHDSEFETKLRNGFSLGYMIMPRTMTFIPHQNTYSRSSRLLKSLVNHSQWNRKQFTLILWLRWDSRILDRMSGH